MWRVRVSATGAVDLGGEPSSGYRFVSPGGRQRWINETDASARGAAEASRTSRTTPVT